MTEPENMIYEYFYGVMCSGKGCNKFVAIKGYHTGVYRGLVDVDLGHGYGLTCPHCQFRCLYYNDDLVYSQRPDEMVPLDQ